MTALRVAQAIAALVVPSAFTVSYTSSDQTISAAGSLTLAHSLGMMPKLIQYRLKCTSTEAGYAVDDEVVPQFPADAASFNKGVAIIPDATNINIRYGSSSNVFSVTNKTTGVSTAITNGNFRMIVRAWA